jgi:hypothetical protein
MLPSSQPLFCLATWLLLVVVLDVAGAFPNGAGNCAFLPQHTGATDFTPGDGGFTITTSPVATVSAGLSLTVIVNGSVPFRGLLMGVLGGGQSVGTWQLPSTVGALFQRCSTQPALVTHTNKADKQGTSVLCAFLGVLSSVTTVLRQYVLVLHPQIFF